MHLLVLNTIFYFPENPSWKQIGLNNLACIQGQLESLFLKNAILLFILFGSQSAPVIFWSSAGRL